MEYVYNDNNPVYIHSLIANDSILDNKIICKYLSFNAFIDLITNKRLRFSNISTYEDKYEGLPRYKEVLEQFSRSKNFKGDEYNEQRKSNILLGRNNYYASCWNIKKIESFLMWNTYSDFSNGILLFSTVRKLLDSIKLENYENISGDTYKSFYGEIDYGYKRPYKSEHIKAFAKPYYYKEESEFRIVIYEHPIKKDRYKYLDIKPEKFINRIIINPRGTDEFYLLVRNLGYSSGLKKGIIHKSKMFNDSKDIFDQFLKKLPII